MQDSLDKKYEKELTFDLPINVNGLDLYPVKLKDYLDFMLSIHVFRLNKNEINPLFISMTYLDFLVHMLKSENELGMIYKFMLFKCLSLAVNNPDLMISYGKDEYSKTYIKIGDVTLNSKEFDEIRDIILFQNLPNFHEENIKDADLRKDLEEYARLMNKGKKWASLEKQIISVQMGTSLPLKYIYQMTIRKFILTLELTDRKLHYIIYKTASMSGMVKFEKDIDHYLIEQSSGIEDRVVDADSFVNKIQSTKL